jgi:hypothetical protein
VTALEVLRLALADAVRRGDRERAKILTRACMELLKQ